MCEVYRARLHSRGLGVTIQKGPNYQFRGNLSHNLK